MPSRRSFLATTASLLAAGCSQPSRNAGSNPTDTSTTVTTTASNTTTTEDPIHVPTQLPWQASTTYDGTTITPVDAWRQHSVFVLTTPDTFGVSDASGEQFLFVTVTARGDGPLPEPGDFALAAGGTRYPASTNVAGTDGYHVRLNDAGTPYSPDGSSASGWLAFTLPTELDASSAKLRLQYAGEAEGATRWPLPKDVAAAVNGPAPHVKLDKLVVPDMVEAGTTAEISLTATNHGDGPGTFRAAVNQVGPAYFSRLLTIDLSTDETGSGAVEMRAPTSTAADEMRLRVVTTEGSIDRTIPIE